MVGTEGGVDAHDGKGDEIGKAYGSFLTFAHMGRR
jgi:hypothetical protein